MHKIILEKPSTNWADYYWIILSSFLDLSASLKHLLANRSSRANLLKHPAKSLSALSGKKPNWRSRRNKRHLSCSWKSGWVHFILPFRANAYLGGTGWGCQKQVWIMINFVQSKLYFITSCEFCKSWSSVSSSWPLFVLLDLILAQSGVVNNHFCWFSKFCFQPWRGCHHV